MNFEILFLLLVLAAMVVAFLYQRIPADLVACIVLLVIILSGYVKPSEAFHGFGSSAVITMVAMFIVAAGVKSTGVADLIGRSIHTASRSREWLVVALVVAVSALISAFMNNIAAAAIVLPAAMSVAGHSRIPPSQILIPLAFGTILGGMSTLIGTTPNMVTAEIMERYGLHPFGFASFLPFGFAASVCGGIVIVILASRLLPRNDLTRVPTEDNLSEVYRIHERLFALRVTESSSLIGRTLNDAAIGATLGVRVVAIIRDGKTNLVPRSHDVLERGDVLVVRGRRLESLPSPDLEFCNQSVLPELESRDIGVGEVVLAPRSRLINATLKQAHFRDQYDCEVLALWRDGRPLRHAIGDETLRFGDALLIQGQRRKIALFADNPDLVLLSGQATEPFRSDKMFVSLLSFAVMVVLSAWRLAPPHLAAFIAAMITLLGGALTLEQAYREIEWRVVVFVAALLPFGTALEQSGSASYLADHLATVGHQFGPFSLLVAMLCVSSLVSQLLDASLSVVILSPIAIAASKALGVSAYPFLMTISLGASIAFLFPFSHKVNLFVMGAGGYRSRDYLAIGALVSIVVAFVVLLLVPRIYPF